MGLKKRKLTQEYFGRTAAEQIDFYGQLIYHVLVQMNQLEMRAVCLVCGHAPLWPWAIRAVERFNKSCKDTRAFGSLDFYYPNRSGHVGCDHAAKWETSCLSYLRPDCVDLSVFRGREDEQIVGVRGADPRTQASIEIGRKACNLMVEAVVRKAEELLGKERLPGRGTAL